MASSSRMSSLSRVSPLSLPGAGLARAATIESAALAQKAEPSQFVKMTKNLVLR
jgi:hypothetical protein